MLNAIKTTGSHGFILLARLSRPTAGDHNASESQSRYWEKSGCHLHEMLVGGAGLERILKIYRWVAMRWP
jgi:hypothetical protein